MEPSADLRAPSSKRRPTSQRRAADRTFTTRYAAQPTTAAGDRREEEEPGGTSRAREGISSEDKKAQVWLQRLQRRGTQQRVRHDSINGRPPNAWRRGGEESPADGSTASRCE